MKPVSAGIMSEIDRRAQEEFGIEQAFLMENAGRAVAEAVITDIESLENERIAVFCGKGNNGGDGFVAARHLANHGVGDLVVYTIYQGSIRVGSAEDNLILAKNMGIKIKPIENFTSRADKEANFTIAIDSVFGTGFRGELPEEYRTVFSRINSSNSRLYAVDIPSGLDATTGYAAPGCIEAHKTITFGLPKIGFFCGDGPEVSGEISIKDIGFPAALIQSYQ